MYKRKILTLSLLLITALGGFFTFRFYQVFFFETTTFENESAYLFLPKGADIYQVVESLTPLIKSADDFLLAAEKKGYTSRVRSGKYRIKRGMNNNEIINTLRGKGLTVNVVFNNQERLENLAGRISQQIDADSLSLLNAFQDATFLAENGFTLDTALAMYLPNSYQIYWDTTAEEFRDKMRSEYQRFWNQKRRTQAKALGLSPQQVITLAAIVQKETVKVDERPRVAGVYLNRLAKRMKLQADPTVIYALKQEENNFSKVIKRVLYRDLKIKNPYNTYKYKGLPPGPIAMPDLSSIQAVLNAEKHAYLYFVANPDQPGYHLFAKNLRQHNKNKARYVRWINAQKLYR